MKKRLLITSIVMMLVVAVALSTATYAWFTSNTSVSASSIALTAGVNNDPALGIGWGTYDASTSNAGTELVANVTGVLQPACPVELQQGTNVTTYGVTSGEHNIAFNYSTIKNINSKPVFNDNGHSQNVIVFKEDTPGTNDKFFIKNLSPANKLRGVTLSATLTPVYESQALASGTAEAGYDYYTLDQGEYTKVNVTVGETDVTGKYRAPKFNDELVRIAVFKKNATSGNYELFTVMSKNGSSDNTVYGEIVANDFAAVSDTTGATVNGVNYGATKMHYYSGDESAFAGVEIASGGLNPEAVIDLAIVAWLDGEVLSDTYAGYAAKIAFTFVQTAA